jgi:hypothetical protein
MEWKVLFNGQSTQKFNPIPKSFLIALQVAAKRGHVPIVELILKVHNNINQNYLWDAENGVEGAIIQRAVEDAAAQNLNPIPKGFHIALQVAAMQGHVQLLLKVHIITSTQTFGAAR